MLTGLRAFTGCALWTLGLASAGAAGPDGNAKLTPVMLPALVRQYRDVGLPMPPPDAPLLLLPMGSHGTDDGKSVDEYVLGFRLTAGEGKESPGTFLVGTDLWNPPRGRTMNGPALVVDPDKPLTAELYQGPAYFADFPTEVWLATAIQCEWRGYRALARQILARHPMRITHWFVDNRTVAPDPQDPTANRFLYHEINGGDPRKALAAAAWNHWLNVAVSPGTNRREALTHLEKLFAQYPAFKGRERENLLASLRLSVQPGTGRPGSAEAAIDALADGTTVYAESPLPVQGFSDPSLNQLLEMGFAALPALIAHMEDRRLLRGVELPLDGSPGLVSIGELVTELVEAAAGPQLFEPGTRPASGEYNRPKLAREWWAQASKVSQEEYVCAHVFPVERRGNESQWINPYCLWTVAHRYPRRLGDIYERLLRTRPDLYNDTVTAAVGACEGLSREERLRLLHLGADEPTLDRREAALTALLSLDPVDGEARLLRELSRLPTETSAAREPFAPEEEIAWLVRTSDSPPVWAAFEQTARHVSPDLRAHLIERINDGHPDFPAQRTRRLAFLRAFVDDPAPWHDREKERAHPEAAEDPTHTVGNRVIREIGEMVDVHVYYEEGLSANDWARYRAKVLAALDDKP